MASLQSSSSSSSSCMPKLPRSRNGVIKAAILDFKTSRTAKGNKISLQNLQVGEIARGFSSLIEKQQVAENLRSEASSMAMQKMYAIMEIVADRVEMHKNIGEQRENWNSLLLNSINAISLSATTMSAIASAINADGLKLSSTLMFLAATGMLVIMNKIQPSQLAEEQRNATRLFKQLQNQIQTKIIFGNLTETDVKISMEKILALDRAYPLPLLGVMLEKFPSQVEPARWWPERQGTSPSPRQNPGNNGWNSDLETEMKSLKEVLGKRDREEYVRLGGKALKLNKMLAVAGPVLTGMAAVASAASMAGCGGSLAAVAAVCGGLSSVVNALEHGGQVGMVFEMYRSNAGFFNLMQESIETELEMDQGRRENGELFEIKTALQLGRSLSDLRNFASSSSSSSSSACDHHEEFASKLF